jgi:hypothetical protein
MPPALKLFGRGYGKAHHEGNVAPEARRPSSPASPLLFHDLAIFIALAAAPPAGGAAAIFSLAKRLTWPKIGFACVWRRPPVELLDYDRGF